MARKRRGRPIHGWLVIDKPGAMTSGEVVTRVRRLTGAAKAGHAGTLDPIATGVLPIALGEATKCMNFVMEQAKSYRFTMRFGAETDTDDRTGEVIRTSDRRPTGPEITAVLGEFSGVIEQVPPLYSAIKVAGRRAYDLARAGETPDLPVRRIRIDRIELVDMADADHATLAVDCGKGSYMRSLARDLGRRLESAAHIVELRRTRVGVFAEQAAISLDKLAELCNTTAAIEQLLPVETGLADIPALAVTGVQAQRLRCGQAVKVLGADDGLVCVMSANLPVAVAKVEDGDVQPVRVFNL